MVKFELSYELNDNTILVPDLLEVQEPEIDIDYDSSLRFLFEYDFLPRSVMSRWRISLGSSRLRSAIWSPFHRECPTGSTCRGWCGLDRGRQRIGRCLCHRPTLQGLTIRPVGQRVYDTTQATYPPNPALRPSILPRGALLAIIF